MRSRVPLTFLAAGLLILLSGCVTPQELRQQDEATCLDYGFKQGTNEFATCLQRESLGRRYGAYGPPLFGYYYGGPGWYPPPPGMIW